MSYTTSLVRKLGLAGVFLVAACGSSAQKYPTRQHSPQIALPAMQWDQRPEAAHWTRATLRAIQTDGKALVRSTPKGITAFCPNYRRATAEDRAAFWSGLLSALAKYESTWNPTAVGGGGRWIGLTQIAPPTARYFGCKATTAAALKNGAANLSCAVRIAAKQVGRDGVLISEHGRWRGVARDWAPFRDPAKRAAIAAWTSRQAYCR